MYLTMLSLSQEPAADEVDRHQTETEEFKDDDIAVPNEDSGTYPGKDGDNLQLLEAVQGYGVIIAFEDTKEEGVLSVIAVSENSGTIIGKAPEDLFALPNFLNILSEDQAEEFIDRINLLKDHDADATRDEPEIFPLNLVTTAKQSVKFWCALRLDPVQRDVIICELEIDDDRFFPLLSPQESAVQPTRIISSEEFIPGVLEISSPEDKKLPSIYKHERRGMGRAFATRILDFMSRAEELLSAASDMIALLNVLVNIVKEPTGFQRVMVHRFDEGFNGRVVADLIDPLLKLDDLGSNLSVLDLLREAKQSHKANEVQMLYNCDLPNARVVYRSRETAPPFLDLAQTYLRALSPAHVAYTNKIAIETWMSISIALNDEPWGSIVCQSYGTGNARISFPIRHICRFISRIASRSIETLQNKSRLRAWNDTVLVFRQPNLGVRSEDSSERLLRLFRADSGLLSIGKCTKILGQPERAQEGLFVLEHFRQRKTREVIASTYTKRDFPSLKYLAGLRSIAGVLVVPLPNRPGDMFLFFRRPKLRDTEYAKSSGEAHSASSIRECDSWTAREIEVATVLRSLSPDLVWAWYNGSAPTISRLTRLLLNNSAHEVRTPLNAIVNYIEVALESSLSPEIQDHLLKMHDAFESLSNAANDLTNLFMAPDMLETISPAHPQFQKQNA